MRIRITRKELCQLLSKTFNTPVEYVVIKKDVDPRFKLSQTKPLSLNNKIVDQILDNFNIIPEDLLDLSHSSLKIPVIKFLREITGMGLFEAKWAVEHWETWITFVRKYQRYPSINNGLLS